MKKNSLRTVIKKIVRGKATDEEKGLFYRFIYFKQQRKVDYDPELASRIWNKIEQEAFDPSEKQVFLASVMKVAASIVIALGIAITLYFSPQPVEKPTTYLTKSTGRGQKATITFSDGSVVKLNAESSISYPESFTDVDSRALKLTGEAFFDVKRNPEKPFTIQTGDLLTTVLGTSFNITAFPEADEIEVTVATGKVQVAQSVKENPELGSESNPKILNLQSAIELAPGQQATFNKASNELSMREVNLKQFIAWKDGVIYISKEGYKEVFEKLSRWYGVEFEFANVPSAEWDYSGEFKDMNLDLVLSTIGYAGGFEYQIHGSKVEIEFNN